MYRNITQPFVDARMKGLDMSGILETKILLEQIRQVISIRVQSHIL